MTMNPRTTVQVVKVDHKGRPVAIVTWGEAITSAGLDAAVGIMERWAFACEGIQDEHRAARAMRIAALYAKVAST